MYNMQYSFVDMHVDYDTMPSARWFYYVTFFVFMLSIIISTLVSEYALFCVNKHTFELTMCQTNLEAADYYFPISLNFILLE